MEGKSRASPELGESSLGKGQSGETPAGKQNLAQGRRGWREQGGEGCSASAWWGWGPHREGAREGGRGRGISGRERFLLRERCPLPQVLKGWLTSAKEWERERALRVCAHVLGACKERFELTVSRDPPRALGPHSPHSWPRKGALPGWVLGFGAPGITGQPFCLPLCPVAAQGAGWAVEASRCWGCLRPFSCCSPLQRGCPCKQFGSLVGLLGSLTSDCLATSQQRAWVCLGYLLQMQGEESGRFPALLSLILPPFLAWHHRGPAGPGPVPGREGGGNVLGWFCAPTLLALCHPSHLRKDPWERVAESHLPGLSVRLGGQGHLSLLSESRTLSPVLGTVPLHGCPPPRSRRDRGWSDNLLGSGPRHFRGCLPPRSLPSAWRDRQLPRHSPNSCLPGKKSPAQHKRGNQFSAQRKLGREEGSELQAQSVLQRGCV